MNLLPLLASGQGFFPFFISIGVMVVLTLGTLFVGVILACKRKTRKLGNRILRIAIVFAALEFAAFLLMLAL